jgi:hypothetical protein
MNHEKSGSSEVSFQNGRGRRESKLSHHRLTFISALRKLLMS